MKFQYKFCFLNCLQKVRINSKKNKKNKSTNKNILEMQVEYPSLQDIYDMSTQQLTKLLIVIQNQIKRQKKSDQNQVLQRITQLHDNIELEIQQRKTIEFFTQMCINDGTINKHVQQITNFNNQFKKLANQLLENKSINNQQPNNKNQNNNLPTQSLKNEKQNDNLRDINTPNTTKSSINRESTNKTTQTQNSQFSHTSTSEIKSKASKTSTKTMGLGVGSMKKNKNAMNDFIRATLSKSKAVQYISSKGGQIKKSPQKLASNQSNISSTRTSQTPITKQKSLKPSSQQSQISSVRNEKKSQATKNNISSQKSIDSRQTLIKKRNQVIQKIKKTQTTVQNHHKKNQFQPVQNHQNKKNQSQNVQNSQNKKKNTKVDKMDAKSMIQMVKMEEQAKKKREQQPQITRQQKVANQKIKTQQKNTLLKSSLIEQHIDQENINAQKHNEYQNIKKQIENRYQLIEQIKQLANKQKKTIKQKQFPIKQQINVVLSSSDTQSDNQGLVSDLNKKSLDSNNKISNLNNKVSNLNKKISTQQKSKQQFINSIPEQQIQQSIVFGQQFNKNVNEKSLTKIQTLNEQSNTIKNNIDSINHINKNHKDSQVNLTLYTQQKKVQQINTNKYGSQNFGNITVEDYNPNPNYSQSSNSQQIENQTNQQKVNYQQQIMQKKQETIKQNKNQLKKNNSQSKLIKKQSSKQIITKTNKKLYTKQQKQDDSFIPLPTTQQIQKKCYNQQYWLHIKQEAQGKIQRFKQEKQLEKKQRQLKEKQFQQDKRKLKSQLQSRKNTSNKSNSQNNVEKPNNVSQKDSTNATENSTILGQDDHDKFILEQKQNLKKIFEQNNINGTKKVLKKAGAVSIIKQPKAQYQKAQFNYLQFFPTFNHIFNIFHTKQQSQAIVELPSVMKQMIVMFSTHLEYLNNRTNNFRPAIFLPFDRKANHFSDARQLLQHAETTHVNLKTLVQRLQVFNANLQGQFQNQSETQKEQTQYYRVVKTKQQVYDIITTSFLRRKGWKQLPHGQNLKANWNLFWSWSKPDIDLSKLLCIQKINHFPFNKNLSRKDLLYKNIFQFRRVHKVSFPYLPLTFNLPKQFTLFSKRFHEEQLINRDKNYWIMKPIGKSRGRGIKLINSLGDLNYLDNIVVQKYIANPLLIDGYKFDMRIYVLVTSFHPLQAFVYRQGFARLSTEKYSMEPVDMKNNFVHLTNFAINRHNDQAADQFSGGSKISLKSLKQKVTKMGYSFSSVWSQVHEIIIKSLLACSVSVPPFPGAFELFGYDIMLDTQGQCHLIQINASPSLQRSYLIDQIIKQSLIDDIIQIVDPVNFSKEQLINVMNQRLAPDFRNNKKNNIKIQTIQEEDNLHLARILKYKKLRKIGEIPDKLGLFQMVAPSQMTKDLEKLIKSKSGINNPHNID